MTNSERLAVAHDSLSLTEAPYMKHYQDGRFREWNGVAFTGSVMPGPGFNFAAVLRPSAPTLDELLPAAREFFAGAQQGWGILVEGDAGHPMEAELRGRGWVVAEDEPAFVMEMHPNPPTPFPPREGGVGSPLSVAGRGLGEGFVVRHVTATTDIAAYVAVTTAAFHAPPEFADMMVPSLAYALDPDLALFVGRVNGDDVSAVGYSRSGNTAVIAGTATLDAHRGKGYGAAVVRFALDHAAGRGCTSAALRSGPKSIPLYERLGFQYVCQHRTYAAPPSPDLA